MSLSDWNDISTIIVGIMTVIVGGVSVAVMLSQRDIADKAITLQKREHQPVFKVIIQTYEREGRGVYDVMSYTLRNDGHKVKSYQTVSVDTYLKLSLVQHRPKLMSYGPIFVPINGYFDWFTKVFELQGVVYKSIESAHCANNEWFGEIYKQAMAYGQSHPGAYMFVELVHLTNVSYVDIYDEAHTCYFINDAEVDANAYNDVKTASSKIFPYHTFLMSEIALDDLAKVAMESGKKK